MGKGLRLVIVRHGKAQPAGDVPRDADRRLVARGRAQARWLAERLAASAWRPGAIASSPYERALATAEVIADAAGVEIELEPALEADRQASRALAAVEERASAGEVLAIVGHNPQLSRLLEVLVGDAAEGELRTGEAALVELPEGRVAGRARLCERWRMDGE
jgi:phosphohistidine phosphatase